MAEHKIFSVDSREVIVIIESDFTPTQVSDNRIDIGRHIFRFDEDVKIGNLLPEDYSDTFTIEIDHDLSEAVMESLIDRGCPEDVAHSISEMTMGASINVEVEISAVDEDVSINNIYEY